jgi:hypothetical protein
MALLPEIRFRAGTSSPRSISTSVTQRTDCPDCRGVSRLVKVLFLVQCTCSDVESRLRCHGEIWPPR